jgi:hypothetical protein
MSRKLLLSSFLVAILLANYAPYTFAQTNSLSVNANTVVNPFSNKMLGVGMVNWEHSWGRPFPNAVPGLAQAFEEAHVGVIRYAGGLWANDVGWDRVNQRTPYTTWTKNGNTYYFHYGTNEIDALSSFAKTVGSDVMIQVNIVNNDPAMWADMVRYTNIEHNYNFKYWEMGNELDYATDKNVSPDTYATRIKAYIDAMKDVDPTIQIVGGVPASAHDAIRNNYSDSIIDLNQFLTKTAAVTSSKGRTIDALSYHWYQQCNASNISDLLIWQFSGTPTNSWRNQYSRIWSEIAPSRVQNEIIKTRSWPQGITELNYDACNYDGVLNGNQLNAIWFTDVIGRLAYNGLDFSTWYEGYSTQGYSLVYPDNGDTPTKLFLRPSYYGFLLYARYFGNQMVSSTTYDPSKISIWASKDTNDPNSLKLIVTNLTNSSITAPIAITGFTPQSGSAYVMKSSNPIDMSATSNQNGGTTTINGVKIDAMNVSVSASTIQPVTIPISGSTITYTFPAYSATAIVLKSGSVVTSQPTGTIAPKPGDANGDGKVDGIDYIVWLTHYNSTLIQTGGSPIGDFNNNGKVDGVDYITWLTNYNL